MGGVLQVRWRRFDNDFDDMSAAIRIAWLIPQADHPTGQVPANGPQVAAEAAVMTWNTGRTPPMYADACAGSAVIISGPGWLGIGNS
jgi:hypothetical protein